MSDYCYNAQSTLVFGGPYPLERTDGRLPNEIRETTITVGYQNFAEGSALIEMGQTKVICAASIETRIPGWLRGAGKGWITAEYSMLPRSTLGRNNRQTGAGAVKGRYQEIQRLIGRSLRSVTDLSALGERTVLIDCDVLQADGGTRTAAITGSYVALYQSLYGLLRNGIISKLPLNCAVAGISVGVMDANHLMLDPSYEEDFRAMVDFNIAMTSEGDLVEIQASGEQGPFDRILVDQAIDLAGSGTSTLLKIQRLAIESIRLS